MGPGRDDFDRELGQVGTGRLLINYEFFRPLGHEDSSDKIPLVVYLHGFGDGRSEQQRRLNATMLRLVSATQRDNAHRTRECFQEPTSCAGQDDEYASYLLVPKIPFSEGWSPRLPAVRELIDDFTSRYQIDDQRIYLTGFSNGGFATIDMIERHPDFFAAGVPISGGGFPNPSTVEALKQVPLWFFHGADDGTVNPSFSINLVNALEAAGGDVQLSLVPGGHNSGYGFAFSDENNQFYPWLFSQSLAVPEPSCILLFSFATMTALFGNVHTSDRTNSCRAHIGHVQTEHLSTTC